MLWILRSNREMYYDTYDSFVVRARNSKEARQLVASNPCGDEGRETWLNDEHSTCEPLKNSGESGVILGSYNA